MAPEPLLTRYRILTGDENGIVWTFVGTVDANSRDTALRKYFATPPDAETLAVAVAESGFRPMNVAVKVQTSLTEQPLPEQSAAISEQADPVVPDGVVVPVAVQADEPSGALV